jgi:hypothetical protein
MAKPIDLTVDVDGKTVILRFSMLAFDALCRYFKVETLKEMGNRLNDTGKFTTADVVAIVHSAMLSHQREATEEDALIVADGLGVEGVLSVISKLIGGDNASAENNASPLEPTATAT